MNKKTKSFFLVSLFLGGFIILISWMYLSPKTYPDSHDVPTQYQTIKSADEGYIIIHKAGCKRCHQASKSIVPALSDVKVPILVVEAGKMQTEVKNDSSYPNILSLYQVNHYPTILHLKSGVVVDRYSGANRDKIEQILKGRN
ncbi:thioredoxin [Fructobacillus fructosus]|uniref:hypothetical protein n=2 Tax=Fructobacillus fructosus TaxID=1631 RepID=UPI000675500F|nr:hypothetical protein [Fructobacillus fructosus]KRN51004.1 hypothetical protein IV71_GL000759 [Fructobacillus fructosus KCTC 3544]GAP01069.1 thioredoxin [Fructobacillus fructosus]